jgi:hypothetical protein
LFQAVQKARKASDISLNTQQESPIVSKNQYSLSNKQASIDPMSRPLGTRADSHTHQHKFLNSNVRFNFANTVQDKLKVSQPDDVYEKEADRVAEQVMRMSSPSSELDISLADTPDEEIETKCKSCEDEEEEEKLEINRETTSSGRINDVETSEEIG